MNFSTLLRRAALGGLGVLGTLPIGRFACAQSAADEVVVTGVPDDRPPGELAQSVSVVRDDALNRVRAANLGEALASQVGVSSSYFGAGASRPIIRGLAGARVRTLQDGLGSMDVSTVSDDHAVSVEPLVAEQIEIFRGPTTLLYGSGAVGGVINTVTARIPAAAPADGFAGGFELRGDSVANGVAAAVRLDGGGDTAAWHFDAQRRDSGDYDIPGFAPREPAPGDIRGTLPNSAVTSDAAAFGASRLTTRGHVGAAGSTFRTLYGIPSDEEEAVRIDLKQRRLDVRGAWLDLAGAIDRVEMRAGFNDYEHLELEGEDVGTRFTNDSRELRVELTHAPLGRWTGAFGVQLGERDFAALGEEAFVPPVDTHDYGVFLVEQLDLDLWDVSFGGRLETQEHRPSNDLPDRTGSAASASFAAVRDLRHGLALALNVALAERLPVAEELYANGPHHATGVVQVGNPALAAETSTHVDLGIRGQKGERAFAATAFVTRYERFIYLDDTGAVDPVHDLPVFAFLQRGARFTGLEAELFTPIAATRAGAIEMRLFADYVRGELDDGTELPRMPPLRYGARFQYRGGRVLAGIEGAKYGSRERSGAFETPTEGYTMINADFLWRFAARRGAELELFASGSNLADREARKHTSFVKDLAPLPGRNYVLGVRSTF